MVSWAIQPIAFRSSRSHNCQVVVMETIGDWAANEFMVAWHIWHYIWHVCAADGCVSASLLALAGQYLPGCIWQALLSECKMDSWKGVAEASWALQVPETS